MSSMNQKLKVMIDVSAVPYGRGVSRYTSNLVKHLGNRQDLEVTAFGYSQGQYGQLEKWAKTLPKQVQTKLWRLSPSLLRKMWHIFHGPSPVSQGTQVYHAWDWQLAPVDVPQVVTIHDLAYKLFPETAHPVVSAHYDQLIAQLEKQTDIQVITVSQTSKNDIIRLTKIASERVHVVYQSLPEEAEIVPQQSDLDEVAQKYSLNKPFLLFVGTTEPRKNLKNIIRAWQQVKDQFDLVIAGAAGWDEFKEQPGMQVLGYVSSLELAALYRLAHVLVFPSLYEGFGLPILEAYFHGCPVITAHGSSMKEIAGKPAILVDPNSPDEIAEAILAVEARDSRARRKRIADMTEVLQEFRWEKTAAQTAQVYQIAAGKKQP